MAKLIVMDHTGDTQLDFDAKNAVEVDKAMARFNELVKEGFTAARRTGAGQSELVRSFDPSVEQTVFFPRLQGG